MNSNRPYLIRALYEWIVDNACTPYIMVDAEYRGAIVPLNHVQDGRIVLNLAPDAIRKLIMNNNAIEFNARFDEVVFHVVVPISAVLAIYAHENGDGMMFEPDDSGALDEEIALDKMESLEKDKPKKGKPHLRIIKSDKE